MFYDNDIDFLFAFIGFYVLLLFILSNLKFNNF